MWLLLLMLIWLLGLAADQLAIPAVTHLTAPSRAAQPPTLAQGSGPWPISPSCSLLAPATGPLSHKR